MESVGFRQSVGTDPQWGSAARAIANRLEEVVAVARERIVREEPAYQRMSAEELDDVAALLHSNFRVLISAMAGGRVDRERLEYVGDHVRSRVRTGIPLESVLEAYRTGLNVFWEQCTAEVAAQGLARDAAVQLARTMSEAMDTLTTHAAAAYVREESYLRATREKAARHLLEALLRGESDTALLRGDGDGSRFDPHTVAPGLDPQADLVVVVGRVAVAAGRPGADALETAAAALADRLATRRASPLLVVREHAVVAVALAEAIDRQTDRLLTVRRALAEDEGVDLYCGVSSVCDGFGGVAAAFEQASHAVAWASAERPVVSLATLPAIEHLLSGATRTTRQHLLDKARAICELPDSARAAMRVTLFAFAARDLNITHAAADLHVHENTLRYRLRRVRERTGHDPRTFAGLLELICLLAVADDELSAGDHLQRETGVELSELLR